MRVQNDIHSAVTNQKSEKNRDILGKDDFLQLLITQLRHQDPTNPIDDREFIAQMAQFSSLEQMQNMSDLLENYLASQYMGSLFSQATGLIGHTVKVDAGEGIVKEGLVDSVRFTAHGPVIMIDGTDYQLADILEISK